MLIKPGMCVKYNSKRWYTAQYGVVVSKKAKGKFWIVNYGYLIINEPYMDIELINLKDVVSMDQIECINHIGIYNVANIQYLLHLKADVHEFHENIFLALRYFHERLKRVFNEYYIKQDCFWEDIYKGKEKEFIEEIADATKISDFKDFFYFDGTINRGTN
jgi:hypothetical protein